MSRAEKGSLPRVISHFSLLILDVVCLVSIYSALTVFRYKEEGAEMFFSWDTVFVMVLTTIFHLFVIGGYNRSTDMMSIRFMGEYLITLTINLLISLVLLYFIIEAPSARAIVAVTLLVFPAISLFYRRRFYQLRVNVMHRRSIYVLGSGSPAKELYESVKARNLHHKFEFFDLTNKKEGEKLISDFENSPTVKGNFLESFRENRDRVDLIVLALEPKEISDTLLEWLISKQFIDVQVQTLAAFYSDQWRITSLSHLSPYWAFEEGFLLKTAFSFERTKRIFDIIMASLILVCSLPISLLAAFAIKVSSRGPVFFKQIRVGRNQKVFGIYKFRSMHMGSDKGDRYTQPNDARVTIVGAFIRKTRIDEIPQLWNVIRGDMSLVGPRPEWDVLVEEYEQKIPYYHFRHLVKPGITGWAQVNYPYGASSHDAIEKLKYDLYYVRNYSFFLDLTIGLKTLYVMFLGKGQ